MIARRVTWIGAAATSLLLAAGVPAAEFGVDRGTPPPGWFVLVGENAIQAGGLAWALGDIPHKMTLYIEVTAPNARLTIDLYDPGLYNPAGLPGAQLDHTFTASGIVGEMYYALVGPNLTLVQPPVTYNADTAATNRSLVRFFDGTVAAGTYQLVIELRDVTGDDQDLSVFGVSIPNHHVYSYNFCVGENNMNGATITDPIALYPFVDYATAATEGGVPVCGLDFVNYDMDSAIQGIEPPRMSLTTRRGFVFSPAESPHPSTNMSFWLDRVAQVPYGPLDSDDQGVWEWRFFEVGTVQDPVSPSLPNPFDTNAFSMQVYDYGEPSPLWQQWPFDPSFLLPPEDRHPRKIYLPLDGGAVPQKEHMGHSARVIGGQDPVTATLTSTLEVTYTFTNPREYPITITSGTTYVSPSPQFGDPRNLANLGTNLQAAIDGGDPRRINITGTVPAGATEGFTYQVDVTPNAAGILLVNGNGTDFIGGGRPTVVRYTTPASMIYGDDQFGPICSLFVDVAPAICTAHADAVASATAVCAGETVTLDGSGSWVNLCPGGGTIEYQWLVDGNIWQPYPAPAVVSGAPPQSATVTLEVRCSSDPTCADSVDVPITVYPAPAPAIDPAAPSVCNGIPITLTLTNAAAYATFQWGTTPPGLSGDGATTPTVQASQVGAVYTVSATTPDACDVQGSVTIADRVIPPPTIVPADPLICPTGPATRIEAQGTWALCEWSTNPPGADGDGSRDCFVDTLDAGVVYTVTVYDADGCSAQASVTTTLAQDIIPADLGAVLRVRKIPATDDVRIRWTDLPQPMGEYWIPHLDGDADGDGVLDTVPSPANILAAPYFVQVPGVQFYVQVGGQRTSSWLVFYKVRAVNVCYGTPGPP